MRAVGRVPDCLYAVMPFSLTWPLCGCLPQLPPEDVKDFLEQMSVSRVNRGWEFLLPSDAEFIRKHPDVAQRQYMLWLGIQAKYDPNTVNSPCSVRRRRLIPSSVYKTITSLPSKVLFSFS